jgi:UDP-N-acetylmuramoylalanine-D-glutamate ligase
MKLLGNRIYLEMPKQEEENKLIVDDNTKEALQREMLKKFSKLTVHTVGDTISNVKKGDVVLVDPGVLGKAPLVDLSETEQVLLVSPFDIIMIW